MGRKALDPEEKKARIAIKNKLYYEAHKEERKIQYYQTNKDKIIEKIENIKRLMETPGNEIKTA